MTRSSVAGIVDRLGVGRLIPLAIALSLLLAACVPLPGSQQPGPTTATREEPPSQSVITPIPAAAAAQTALAAKLDVPASQITTVSAEHVDWPDACLGAATEGEICAQVITPGYRIVLESNGRQYEARTDENGQVIRLGS
jgi:hypothetical protein